MPNMSAALYHRLGLSHATTPSSSQCKAEHDAWSLALGIFLCVGLVISYLPQIFRIILKKSSLGFSPWFLLLGGTSSASSFLNVVTLSWGSARCCTQISTGQCLESLLGVIQVGLQWILFVTVFALFLVYYPLDKRFERSIALPSRRNTAASGSVENDDDAEDEDDDSSSIGDIDSIGSHIAANYSTFTSSNVGDSNHDAVQNSQPSASETPESSAVASRFAGVRDNPPTSSSAFDRLVPSFWPMWKAPPQQPPQPPSRLGPGLLPSAGPAHPQGQQGSRQALLGAPRGLRRKRRRVKHRTPEWALALALGWIVAIHFIFIVLVTLLLVSTLPTSAFPPSDQAPVPIPPVTNPPATVSTTSTMYILASPTSRLLVNRWAAFLGITGTLLAAAQYVPQIVHTARVKTVGSLSIPTMLFQVPGSILFVYSLAIRPGVDWTSLAAYICTGVLQLVLLVLCICWTVRQKRLGIDDYGKPLSGSTSSHLLQGEEDDDQGF